MFTLRWLYFTELFLRLMGRSVLCLILLVALSDSACPVHFGFPSQIITSLNDAVVAY